MPHPHEVTQLLNELEGGDESAFDRLVPLIYEDLKIIARRYTRGQGSSHTLNTTGLVHEAYLRLVDRTQVRWTGRDHFLAVYSVVMRNLLVDLARERKTAKHGGELKRVTFDASVFLLSVHITRLPDPARRQALRLTGSSARPVIFASGGKCVVNWHAFSLHTVGTEWFCLISYVNRSHWAQECPSSTAPEQTVTI